jgi:hypothetical protein
MKKALTVNFFAGPGAGKSTTAAGVFHALKVKGVDSELVSEFAKDKTWERNHVSLSDQFFVTANQHYRQFVLEERVDVIVTDSPLLIGLFYYNQEDEVLKKSFFTFIQRSFSLQNNLNFLIKRTKKFNQNGRNQSEHQATQIDTAIKKFLDDQSIEYTEINGDSSCIPLVSDMIVGRLGEVNEVR